MIVLVTGSRKWDDMDTMYSVLSSIHRSKYEPCVLVHGDCRGADAMADAIAKQLDNMYSIPVPADWDKYKNAAGPVRNTLMLRVYKPDLVVAFHEDLDNSKGTADMMNQAVKAGIKVEWYDGI